MNNSTFNSSFLPYTETTTFLSHDPDPTESGDTQSYDINSDQNGGSNDVFDELRKARRKNRDNVFITYLNVNSLRYKFIELGDILYDKLSDICFFAETKLDDTFNQQEV